MRWSNFSAPIPPGCPWVKLKNRVIKKGGATKSEMMRRGGTAMFKPNFLVFSKMYIWLY